jgi:protein arginine kinase activator
MFCDKCNNSDDPSNLSGISNDIQSEQDSCIRCSKNAQTGRLHSILFGEDNQEKCDAEVNIKCSNCGLTIEELIYDGRPGCPICYKYFSSFFRPYFESSKINEYNGKKPLNYIEITDSQNNTREFNKRYFDLLDTKSKLEDGLKTAVIDERYEDAAIIRDKLKEVMAGE